MKFTSNSHNEIKRNHSETKQIKEAIVQQYSLQHAVHLKEKYKEEMKSKTNDKLSPIIFLNNTFPRIIAKYICSLR